MSIIPGLRPVSHQLTRKVFLYLLLCLAIILSTTPMAYAYQQDIKALSAAIAESISQSGKKTVAVVDFTDPQGNVTELGRFLAEQLSVALAVAANDFEVIDRIHLKAILQQHKLAPNALIDPQTARRLGEIAGVEALVTGSITPLRESVSLSVKLLDVPSAKIIAAATGDIPKTGAIAELLPRETGSGAQPATTPATEAPPATAQQNDFFLTLTGCWRIRQYVACFGSVTNKAAQKRFFKIQEGSYLADDQGNEHTFERIRLGGEGVSPDLEPETPAGLDLFAKGIAPDAVSVTVVLVYDHPERSNSYPRIELRDVPLWQR